MGFCCVVVGHIRQQQGVGQTVGDMVFAAQLVGHGMVQAQEGVGEGHTGDAGGVVHFLPGHRILRPLLIRPGKIVEYHIDGLQSQPVGVVAGHVGDIGLQRHGSARPGR